MKILVHTLTLWLVLAYACYAQIALEAVAFIESPSGVHYVFATDPSFPGTGRFTYVNTNNGDFDIITVTVAGDRSFQGVSVVTGRSATGQISENAISMTFLGVTRAGPQESIYGPTNHLAGRYYGFFSNPNSGVGALQGFVSSNGKFLVYGLLGPGTNLGIGTISGNGDFFVRFTSGGTGSGNFSPFNGIASGNIIRSSGIVETYFGAKGVPARLGNIATRGLVGTGEQVLIGGLIIIEGQKGVLLIAKGPSLAAFGIQNPVQNPQLQLFQGSQLIASNQDWQTNANATQIAASGLAPSDSREAAFQVTLEPGAYTVIVSSQDATTGVGIVEIYGVGGPLGR